MPHDMLTQAQANALPDGAKVWVIWSGGNGPHLYTVEVDAHGERRTVESGDRLDFVGQHPLTQIWLD